MNPIFTRTSLLLTLAISTAFSFSGVPANCLQANDVVEFDVPAIGQCGELESDANGSKLISLNIPVSVLVKDPQNIEFEQLLIAVYWSGGANLVHDYAPQTSLISDIDGNISIQKQSDRNNSIGLEGTGGYKLLAGVNGQLNLGNSKRESTSYQLKPEQHLLAASGPIKRGTGVYYKFRASTQTTLEGSHQLDLQFQVPASWRTGILRVDCQVSGHKNNFSGFDSSFQESAEFNMALCMADDIDAFESAANLIQIESELLQWRIAETPQQQSLFSQIGDWLNNEPKEPAIQWNRYVVYGYTDARYAQIKSRIPGTARTMTDNYVAARKNFIGLKSHVSR